MSIRRMCIISFLVAMIIALEQILASLPGIQLTTVLIVLICITYTLPEVLTAIFVYTTIDVLVGGGLYYYPFMLISWMLFALTINLLKNKRIITLGIISGLFAFFYTLVLSIADTVKFSMNLQAWFTYIINGMVITIVFAICNILTVVLLLPKLKRTMDEKSTVDL